MCTSEPPNIEEKPSDLVQIRQGLEAFDIVRFAVAFGSIARGQPRPDSDLDLAGLAEKPLSAKQRIELIDALASALGRPVDLVDLASHILSGLDRPAPSTMGDVFDLLAADGVIGPDPAKRMRKAVGFRTIAVHNDEAINWEVVFSIVNDRLEDFSDYARSLDHWLPSGQ
ncbi:MAG: hypothetical protein RL322_1095 [Pseudomonadota bacterium]|jgi:predicted nucleotidyltransferase